MKLLHQLFVNLLLSFSTDIHIEWLDRARYVLVGLAYMMPLGVILKLSDAWFENNRQFVSMFFVALLLNTFVGIGRHLKTKSFNWVDFAVKNAIIVVSIIIVYVALELIVLTMGNLPPVQYFEMTIQVMSLMYPISKTIKNIYIISDRKYPPRWLMERLYNFERTGNIEKFFKK